MFKRSYFNVFTASSLLLGAAFGSGCAPETPEIPSEVAAASKVARAAAVDAALVAELSASESDDEEESAATTAVAEEAVATQNVDEADAERAAALETFAVLGAASDADALWAFDDSDDEEGAFAFDVDLNVEF